MDHSGGGEGIRVLVVEDSATQAEQLRHLLERHGYRVEMAKNGQRAMEQLASGVPGVILSDVVMPEMDGFELCRRVKADPEFRHIPVILLTALSEPEDIIRSLESGADNFLTKPFEALILLERVRQVLDNVELRKDQAADLGVEVFFAGRRHVINTSRVQILDMLLSTYENAFIRHRELEKTNRALTEANRKITALSGLIPICARCKKIKNDQGYWKQVETYISEHTESVFSHGLCPGCLDDSYEELRLYIEKHRD